MKSTLDRLHSEFSREERLVFDPLFLLDRSLPVNDQEIISFLLAGLAYGRVEQIQNSARELLRRLYLTGTSPTGAGLATRLQKKSFHQALEKSLFGWKHRLNTEDDLKSLFKILAQVLKTHGSLKSLMSANRGKTPTETIVNFSAALARMKEAGSAKTRGRASWQGTGPEWFFASPIDGSSCKRLMLWLRWMIRTNDIDPGVWHLLDTEPLPFTQSDLLVPLDVHIFRWAQEKKITRFKTPSWKAVEEISAYMRTMDASDPLKYDFAIFQQSFEKARRPGKKSVKKIRAQSSKLSPNKC
jgi:uncharacterized protein (TIGR02757 family)